VNVQDVIDRVLRKFGDEASVQITPADIIRFINDGQKEIAYKNEVLQAIGTMDIVAGVNSYPIPSNLLTLRTMYYDGSRVQFMEKTAYDEYVNSSDPKATSTGFPLVYTRWANLFYLYPVPSNSLAGGLKLEFTQRPADVVGSADALSLPLEYHNAIVDYCMAQAYETDEAWDAAAYKGKQWQDSVNELSQATDIDVEYYPTITVLPEDY
jgi:hypothetical protein